MQHLADDLGLLKLVDLFDDEVLSVFGLPAHLLPDRMRAGAHCQMMLNHLPRDARKV